MHIYNLSKGDESIIYRYDTSIYMNSLSKIRTTISIIVNESPGMYNTLYKGDKLNDIVISHGGIYTHYINCVFTRRKTIKWAQKCIIEIDGEWINFTSILPKWILSDIRVNTINKIIGIH
jgi:hypothetical protein